MRRTWIFALLSSSLIISAGFGQNPGDQPTAGFTNSRTYFNSNAGDFKPPLELAQTLNLDAETGADTLSVFEDYLLIGRGGDPSSYRLLDRDTGEEQWRVELGPATDPLDYSPAYSDDIVLLGGSATTSVTAVRVSTGAILWQDKHLGSSAGRSPILTQDLAIYAGSLGVAAARPQDGTVVWQYPPSDQMGSVELAAASVSMEGSRVYVLAADSRLIALDLLTGAPVWASLPVGGDGSDIIAVAKYVYVNEPDDSTVFALRADDGSTAWGRDLGQSHHIQSLAFAYDRLFVFGDFMDTEVYSLDPRTGEILWHIEDPSLPWLSSAYPRPSKVVSGQIADNAVYYYHSRYDWLGGRIRVLDAFSGNFLWDNLQVDNLAGMAVADGSLYTLSAQRADVYRPSNGVYLAQLADGAGASTRITLANLSSVPVLGTLEFFDESGNPASVSLDGLPEPATSIDFSLEANETTEIRTTGDSDPLVIGWARATATEAIRGTAVFQVRDQADVLFEAGVGDAPATGRAILFASRPSTAPSVTFSTGIALANPSESRAHIEITFRRRLPDPGVFTAIINLEPGEHAARFLEELFEEDAPPGSEGTLIIESEIPVVVTALRTKNGYPMSSYPVGIPGK